MGNSITDGWINADPDFFSKNPYVDRGISGQTTPQMLVRFREDNCTETRSRSISCGY